MFAVQVANHADVDVEEETVVTDPVSGQSTTMRLPKHFQIKYAELMLPKCISSPATPPKPVEHSVFSATILLGNSQITTFR